MNWQKRQWHQLPIDLYDAPYRGIAPLYWGKMLLDAIAVLFAAAARGLIEGAGAEWIDIIGKIGPVIIAILVGLLGWQQYKFQKNSTSTQLEIGVESLKITLMEKRVEFYHEFRSSITWFYRWDKWLDHQGLMFDLLNQAEFLFSDTTIVLLKDCVRLKYIEHKLERESQSISGAEFDKKMAIEEQIMALKSDRDEALSAASHSMAAEMRLKVLQASAI